MRRIAVIWALVAIEAVFLCNLGQRTVRAAGPTTPTFIDASAHMSTSGVTNSVSDYVIYLLNTNIAGNSIVVGCSWSASGNPTMTVTDDAGDSFTTGPTNNDANQIVQMWWAVNTVGGATKVTVHSSVTGVLHKGCTYAQYAGLGNLTNDGTCNANVANGTLACGSFTTTHNGDLIIHFWQCDSPTGAGSNASVGSPGGSFSNVSINSMESYGFDAEVQVTAGAVNPTETVTNCSAGLSVGVALQASAGGSGATISGLYLQCIAVENFPNAISSTQAFQMPCGDSSGNLITWTGNFNCTSACTGAGTDITAVSDGTNSYQFVTGTGIGGSTAGCAAIMTASNTGLCLGYACNATIASSTRLTFTWTGSDANMLVAMAVWKGAKTGSSTACFDKAALTTSTCTASPACVPPSGASLPLSGPTLTPSVANEGAYGYQQEDAQAVTGTGSNVGTPHFEDIDFKFYGSNELEQDGGLFHIYLTTTAAVTPTFSYSNYDAGQTVQGYGSIMALFLPAVGAPAVHNAIPQVL